MGRSGTNNGGGPRWADMERAECPRCGLFRPVGTMQVIRNGGCCLNPSKCDARAAKRAAKHIKQADESH